MMTSTTAVTGWTSIAIWLLIYLPFSIYGSLLFYRYRVIPVIHKRHVSMTLVILFSSISHFCIERVLWMISICSLHSSTVFSTASSVLFPIIFYGVMFSLLCRFWILRYDIEFVRAQCNNKWRAVINDEYIEHNWFIQHRSSFGNTNYIASRIVIPVYMLFICVSILVRLLIYNAAGVDHQKHVYFNEQFRDCWIADVVLMLLPCCSIIYLWSKTPNINDSFWIRAEQRWLFILLLVLFLSNVAFGISALYFKYEFVLLSIVESHIICAANFGICLILTFGVFRQNRNAFHPHRQLKELLTAQKNRLSNASNQSNGKQTHSVNHQLRNILQDSIIFHAFMAHLATEFSMECLLAIIEFTEYGEYVLDNFSDYVSSKHDYRSKLIQLPPDIPQSQIVFGSSMPVNKVPVLQHRCHSHSSHDRATSPTPPPTLKGDNNSNTVTPLPLPATNSNLQSSNHPLTAQPSMSANHSNQSNHSNHSNHESGAKIRRSPSRSKGLYADLKPLQVKALLLYDKYIKVGSEYEINISGPMRNEVQSMLENEELWSVVFESCTKNSAKMKAEKIISEKLHEILTLLSVCVDEMIKLLTHSFHRFQQTNGYDTLIKRVEKLNQM